MGKVKLDIKKLENSSNRQATFSKRKHGILKKAQELSILCDIDLALVMFSPGGKPSVCCGKHSIEEVIARLNQLPPHERTKRKLEGLEALKKQYSKSDHDVNIEDFLSSSVPTIKDVSDQAARLKSRLAELHGRLWCWSNPGFVSDFGLLTQMEDSLEKSLNQIQREKENFRKRHHASVEHELKDGTPLSEQAIDVQQLHSVLWTPRDNLQNMILTQEPKLHSQREIESCTGSTSGSYFGCLSTSSKSEGNSPGQLSGIDNVGQDALQGLQFGGLYSYLPYGINMQSDSHSFQTMLSMDQQQCTLAYDAGRNYQPTLPCQDLSNHFPPETSAAAAFADYSNYQWQETTEPAPTIPSFYERMAADSSSLVFDYTPNHYA